jgi:hypothetical protein
MSTGRGHTTGDSKAAVLCVYRVERESAGKAGNLTSHSVADVRAPGRYRNAPWPGHIPANPAGPRRKRSLTADPSCGVLPDAPAQPAKTGNLFGASLPPGFPQTAGSAGGVDRAGRAALGRSGRGLRPCLVSPALLRTVPFPCPCVPLGCALSCTRPCKARRSVRGTSPSGPRGAV